MEFRFVSRRPAGLKRYVESVWFARGRIDYPDERIAPTGSTVAVVVLGDPIRETPADGAGEALVAETGFLLGPHDRPVVNEPLGETHCVGIVTTPVGCEAVFGVRPATIRGRVVDLMTAWPAAGPLRQRLLDRAAAAALGGGAAGNRDHPGGNGTRMGDLADRNAADNALAHVAAGDGVADRGGGAAAATADGESADALLGVAAAATLGGGAAGNRDHPGGKGTRVGDLADRKAADNPLARVAAGSRVDDDTGHGDTDGDRASGDIADALLDLTTAAVAAAVEGAQVKDTGRCERAVAALEADPARSIGALATELGLSHGHLDHEFTEIVGLSPRVLARILRLRVLLARLDVYAPVPWSALAAELGWFDQSHFIRDFKRHTGVTPSEYVAAQRGSYTPDQAAPGFVPRR